MTVNENQFGNRFDQLGESSVGPDSQENQGQEVSMLTSAAQNNIAAALPGLVTPRTDRPSTLRANNQQSANNSFGHGRTNGALKAAASMARLAHQVNV